MKVTFLLPGNSTSGGVRVTMQMGNCLLKRGHDVRIAYRRAPLFTREQVVMLARDVKFWCQGVSETRWLSFFSGRKQGFVRLEDLEFENKEIVVATGIHTIGDLERLQRNVLKVRYCHGLLEQEPEQVRKMWLWSGPMATIAVSPALLPALEKCCTGQILGVVPNGVSEQDYFVEGPVRDGIGMVFGNLKVKGPEVAVAVVKALHERFPGMNCYAFGACPQWKDLSPCSYTRFPSVQKSREIYNRCKIWLVTSRDEGFSLPMLEAMACGCAVISSSHTNASEIIQHGVNGFTVRYGDITGYMGHIERLLEDEALRDRIAKEGLSTVQRFSWDKAADCMEQVLLRLK
jgi:glycosyltransferase involved in cell wall biosynthesis